MPSFSPRTPFISLAMIGASSELDLDVDARRELESHERIDRLRRGVEDVDESLVRAHLEMLARVLVLVRRADDAIHVLLSGQRHRACDLRARPDHRVDDLARRAVDDLVVVGLEPDADLLSRHGAQLFLYLSVQVALGWLACAAAVVFVTRGPESLPGLRPPHPWGPI